MAMRLTSSAFADGDQIPSRHTGEGLDISPPLAWESVQGAQQYALICDDPDAPSAQPWVHWVIYNIPGHIQSLAEGLPNAPRLDDPDGALQGVNSWPSGVTIGHRGPSPPPGHGTHHYHFRLYALDEALDLDPGLTKAELLKAIRGHVIAEGLLMGTYERGK